MIAVRSLALILALALGLALPAAGEGLGRDRHEDHSLKLEVENAVARATSWLVKAQAPGGYWSQPEHPALTGLVLTGLVNEPSGRVRREKPEYLRRGYDYILKTVKPDGGIYVKDLANYNTAVSVMALVAAYDPSFDSILRRARNFLVGQQDDFGKKGVTDDPLDGGIGYGGRYQHSDMSNTMFALEAIHYTKFLTNDTAAGAEPLQELNWQAVRTFLSRCQNLPGSNDQPWASGDPANRGGFVYFPGDSKAGEMDLGNGKKALRSYGSISYAGLLSLIYAEVDKDDPRVKAVLEWLAANYTLEENPGMGQQGLYYYYHTMAKALAAAGVDTLTTRDGRKVNWRRELALRLLNLQREDGSWVNENGRWWEKNPVLVTSYGTIIMEIIARGL